MNKVENKPPGSYRKNLIERISVTVSWPQRSRAMRYVQSQGYRVIRSSSSGYNGGDWKFRFTAERKAVKEPKGER